MKYLLLFLLAILISCSKKDIPINPILLGTWNRNDGIINNETNYLSIDKELFSNFSHSEFSFAVEIIGFSQKGNDYPYEFTLTCKNKIYYSPKIDEVKLLLQSEDSLFFYHSQNNGLWYIKL